MITMYKRQLIALSFVALAATGVSAQTAAPPVTAPAPAAATPTTPATGTIDNRPAATGATTGATGTSTGSTGTGSVGSTGTAPTVTTNPPLAGANSFTEAQARERMAAAGFSTIGALRKDDSGIWRSTAQKGGKTVNVAVDFKGNIVQTN
jgi:hypothetical protein